MIKKKIVGHNLASIMVLIVGVYEKKMYLVCWNYFQEITILPKQFRRNNKKIQSMPLSSDFGQLKPKCMDWGILGPDPKWPKRSQKAKKLYQICATCVWHPSILPLSRDERDCQYTSPSLVWELSPDDKDHFWNW